VRRALCRRHTLPTIAPRAFCSPSPSKLARAVATHVSRCIADSTAAKLSLCHAQGPSSHSFHLSLSLYIGTCSLLVKKKKKRVFVLWLQPCATTVLNARASTSLDTRVATALSPRASKLLYPRVTTALAPRAPLYIQQLLPSRYNPLHRVHRLQGFRCAVQSFGSGFRG
jgi:hypothetical protein